MLFKDLSSCCSVLQHRVFFHVVLALVVGVHFSFCAFFLIFFFLLLFLFVVVVLFVAVSVTLALVFELALVLSCNGQSELRVVKELASSLCKLSLCFYLIMVLSWFIVRHAPKNTHMDAHIRSNHGPTSSSVMMYTTL